MFNWLKTLLGIKPKGKRLYLRFVSYLQAEELMQKGWTLAQEEEDTNKVVGMVYLELLEKPEA